MNFVSSFPKPDEEFPLGVRYSYKRDDENFLYGIMLRGYSPEIEKKLRMDYFIFGVVITIVASLLATMGFEIMREYIKEIQTKN